MTFDPLLKEQKLLTARVPCVDLSTVQFISPAAMVQLVTTCHQLDHDGRRPRLVLPQADVRSYLHRAGMLRALHGVVTCDSKAEGLLLRQELPELGKNPTLMEVTRLDSMEALPPILERLVTTFRTRLRYPRSAALSVATAVSEVCQNAIEHGGGAAAFLAVQVYAGKRSRFVQIGLSDHGPGLTETLRRNAQHSAIVTDRQAIQVATKRGTSGISGDRTRGTGLYHLLEMARRHTGTVNIRSGKARGWWQMGREEKRYFFPATPMRGVHIAINLPDGTG